MINIAFNHFTPGLSLLGGLMIGLSATLLILGVGRVAGIAGIVGGTLQSLSRLSFMGQGVRIAFTAGLLFAPAVWKLALPMPVATAAAGPVPLVLAGLLVGVGVRMGNGCTSGHGVCGLSRLSLRSLANVLAFMGAGMATVYVLRHVL